MRIIHMHMTVDVCECRYNLYKCRMDNFWRSFVIFVLRIVEGIIAGVIVSNSIKYYEKQGDTTQYALYFIMVLLMALKGFPNDISI